jgi:hypothetical protein
MQEIITRGKKIFTAENTFFHGRKIYFSQQEIFFFTAGNFPPKSRGIFPSQQEMKLSTGEVPLYMILLLISWNNRFANY